MTYLTAYLAVSFVVSVLVARNGYVRNASRTSHVRRDDPRFDHATIGAGCGGGLAMKVDPAFHNEGNAR